jgi:hypothetical protein
VITLDAARELPVPDKTRILTADLGPRIAAFTCCIDGQPAAVVNTATGHDAGIRAQAALVLARAGLDADLIIGALHGIRS